MLEMIISILTGCALIGLGVFTFFNRRAAVRAWLLVAVQAAEQLGSGKGQEKLAIVHTRLCTAFPVVSKLIPFSTFSKMVDNALEQLKLKLGQN